MAKAAKMAKKLRRKQPKVMASYFSFESGRKRRRLYR
jgi:hypothetical protein